MNLRPQPCCSRINCTLKKLTLKVCTEVAGKECLLLKESNGEPGRVPQKPSREGALPQPPNACPEVTTAVTRWPPRLLLSCRQLPSERRLPFGRPDTTRHTTTMRYLMCDSDRYSGRTQTQCESLKGPFGLQAQRLSS